VPDVITWGELVRVILALLGACFRGKLRRRTGNGGLRVKICFISNYNVGFGLSGGDRIFIELMKGWRRHAQVLCWGALKRRPSRRAAA